MQTAVREALAEARAKKNIGAKDVAEKTGIKLTRIYDITNGRVNVKDDELTEFRKFFKKPLSWPEEGHLVSLAGTPLYPVPVVGNVEAGEGAYNVDPDTREVFVPKKLSDLGGLGWVVDGESMMPALEPGMVALFREFRSAQRKRTYLVKSEDGGLRVKNLEWVNDEWTLISLNKAFPPEPLGQQELQGFLIGWYYAKGTREKMDTDPNGIFLEAKDVI